MGQTGNPSLPEVIDLKQRVPRRTTQGTQGRGPQGGQLDSIHAAEHVPMMALTSSVWERQLIQPSGVVVGATEGAPRRRFLNQPSQAVEPTGHRSPPRVELDDLIQPVVSEHVIGYGHSARPGDC